MISAALIVLFIGVVYWYYTRTFDYWTKRGVKHDKPIWLFGNNFRGTFFLKSMSQIGDEIYNKYPNEQVIGFFRSTRPELIIRDPDIVKRILMTDFNHFHFRGLTAKENMEPLNLNLFDLNGDLWKLLRKRLTPAFSTSKLKAMFPLIVETAEKLQIRTATLVAKPIDARDLMARYTTDFIGACGFGVDADSLNDDNSEFRKLALMLTKIRIRDIILFFLKETLPRLFKQHIHLTRRFEVRINAILETILRQRNYKPSPRNDFLDLLLECQSKGEMVGESLEKIKPDGTPEIARAMLTRELIAAQVLLFFAAGFETSATTTSYTLNQLAHYPEIQKKVQNEINRVLAKYDNKLCYDAVKEMTYLEWTLKESMRIFPPVGFLFRECACKYTFEDLNLTIDEGVRIFIPVQALHMDPTYFPEPEVFRPERFDPSESERKNKFVFLPFGDGPRACIGERLGMMQSMAGLAAVLSRFTVEPAPGSSPTPVRDPRAFLVQLVKGGLPLYFRERQSVST